MLAFLVERSTTMRLQTPQSELKGNILEYTKVGAFVMSNILLSQVSMTGVLASDKSPVYTGSVGANERKLNYLQQRVQSLDNCTSIRPGILYPDIYFPNWSLYDYDFISLIELLIIFSLPLF